MPSPLPLPDHVKAIRGTLRPCRVREHIEIADGTVEPPVDLPLEAVVIWHELAPALIAAGLLKPTDAGAFGQYCVLTANLRALWPLNEAAPASHLAQWRQLGELFGVMGAKSRVLGPKRQVEANPFARNGRRPPSDSAR
jgi:hypothetical protein